MNISEMVKLTLESAASDAQLRSQHAQANDSQGSKDSAWEKVADRMRERKGSWNDNATEHMGKKRGIGEKIRLGYHKQKAHGTLNANLGKAGAVVGGTALLAAGAHGLKKALTKTSSEKVQAASGSIKDVIKNKIMEHPKAAMAAGAASALGAGYGAYKYLKNRKK